MFSSDFPPRKLRRALALLICCAPVGSSLFAENEIVNPGFEQGAGAWSLQVPKQDEGKGIEMAAVAEAPRPGGSGEKCLKLSSPVETRYSVAPGIRLKGVEPGEHYRISAWVKPGESFACKAGAPGFYIRATLFSAPGKDAPGGHLFFLPGEKVIYGRVPAGSDAQPLPKEWSQVVALFEIPPEVKLLALNFFVEGASGPLYVDDVALDKVAANLPLTPVTGKPSQASTAEAAPALAPVSPQRVAAIAQWLTEKPSGYGRPADDRTWWEAMASLPDYGKFIADAEKKLNAPIHEYSDEEFLNFSKTGQRVEKMYDRAIALESCAMAEALENKGRFLPQIERLIDAIMPDRTWVMPAHDLKLRNFHGEITEVDLNASATARILGATVYWLDWRLPEATRTRIKAEVRRRVLDPYMAVVKKGGAMNDGWWWITGNNNWNAVCNNGVVAAGLCLLDSREERATLLAAAENSMPHFFDTIGNDGFCTEGLGYWNYGFSNYIMAAEVIRNATGGKIDLYSLPKVRAFATNPGVLEMAPGLYPMFGDGTPGTKPTAWLVDILNRRLHLNQSGWDKPRPSVFELAFGAQHLEDQAQAPSAAVPPQRGMFADFGIYILRPGREVSRPFTVALIAGHNGKHHNHNDIGSYTIGLGTATPLMDPGGEKYTARTFSPHRYDSQILSSYGHAVPLVAGKQQSPGRQFHAVVTAQDFSDACDKLVVDLSHGYEVPSLGKLQRTFIYSRAGAGTLEIADEVRFSSPETFGTALLTSGTWKQTGPGSLEVTADGATLNVTITAEGAPFTLKAVPLEGDLASKKTATRIGIDLEQPVKAATIRVKIEPAPANQGTASVR